MIIGSDYPTVEVQLVVVDFSAGRNVYDREGALAVALKDKDIGILVNNVGVITRCNNCIFSYFSTQFAVIFPYPPLYFTLLNRFSIVPKYQIR